jgi:hypothetical protein
MATGKTALIARHIIHSKVASNSRSASKKGMTAIAGTPKKFGCQQQQEQKKQRDANDNSNACNSKNASNASTQVRKVRNASNSKCTINSQKEGLNCEKYIQNMQKNTEIRDDSCKFSGYNMLYKRFVEVTPLLKKSFR